MPNSPASPDSLWPDSSLDRPSLPPDSIPSVGPDSGRTAQLVATRTKLGFELQLSGRWTAAQLARPGLLESFEQSLAGASGHAKTSWDLRGINRFDHIGAQWLWNHWGQAWPSSLLTTPDQRAMLERVARFTVPHDDSSTPGSWAKLRGNLIRIYVGLGTRVLLLGDHLRDLIILVGQLMLDIGRLIRAPRLAPWRDISGNLYRIGATALPITALVGFLIGVVLAYLMARQLRQFGADAFIVDVLGIALIRELGPVLAAILLAGRSGSAITAQIGVMQVTEELDAMKVMGISPGFRLVMPKALALAIAMPLVAVWTTLAALAGGVLAADVVLGITPDFFLMALPKAVEASNLALLVGKSVVFGLLMAIIACHYGLRVLPNTESLGSGTTASVVTSITMVILVNAVFALVFRDVGI